MSGRRPVLKAGRGGRRPSLLLFGLDGRKINGRRFDILGIQLPRVPVRPLRIPKREIVIEQRAIHIHRPARAREIEDDFVLAFGSLEQGERNADGHILPVGMLGGMKRDRGFQHRHRAVGHLERRIILAVAVARIMLPKADAEHIRYFENGFLASELLQVHREFDREAVGGRGGHRELSLRGLRGERALRGLRGVEKP